MTALTTLATASAPKWGLPDDRTVASYYAAVNGPAAAQMVILSIVMLMAYLVFFDKKERNWTQVLGFLIVLIGLYVFRGGFASLWDILVGTARMAVSAVTGN